MGSDKPTQARPAAPRRARRHFASTRIRTLLQRGIRWRPRRTLEDDSDVARRMDDERFEELNRRVELILEEGERTGPPEELEEEA